MVDLEEDSRLLRSVAVAAGFEYDTSAVQEDGPGPPSMNFNGFAQ